MTFLISGVRVTADFISLAVFAFFLLADRTGTAAMFCGAAALHEAGHFLFLRLAGARVQAVRLTLCGVGVAARLPRQTDGAALGLALSGCAANVLAALFCGLGLHAAWAVRFSAVNAAVCAVNLLPLQGGDGGDVACFLLCRLLGEARGARAASALSVGCLLLAAAAVCWTLLRLRLYLWGIAALAALAARLAFGEVE